MFRVLGIHNFGSATTQHAIKCVFHTVQDQTAVFTSVVRVKEEN